MTQPWKTKTTLATALALTALLWAALAPVPGAYADPPAPGAGVIELKADPSALQADRPSPAEATNQTLEAVTLDAIADTMIAQGKPNKNYWSAWEGDAIKVGYDSSSGGEGKVRGLVRFDLSPIPAGSTISSARLRLYYGAYYDYAGHSRRVTTYRVTGPWREELVTWDNRPDFAEAYGFVDLVAGGQGDFHYYDWTVTGLVQAWVDGSYDNHGILLRGDETVAYRGFFSWESGADYTPQLVVNFTPPPPTLEAWPTPLSFILNEVGAENRPVIVSNAGTGSLNWNASILGGSSWLALDDTNGSAVGWLSPQTVGVSVNTSGLAPGLYEDQVRITSSTPGVAGSPQLVPVQLAYGVSLYDYQTYLPTVLKGSGGTTPVPGSSGGFAAVVVGIADYEHMEPGLGARAGSPGIDPCCTGYDAGKSAYAIEHIGPSCGCGGAGASIAGLGDDNVLVLTDARATKTAIRDAITKWLDVREDKDTLVMFFFSGHGMYDLDDNGDENDQFDEFLVPYDVDCDPCYPQVENPVWLSETAISDDELDSWLDELEAERIVIVIDSCFSGGMVEATAGAARTLSGATRVAGEPGPLAVGDGFAMDVEETGRLVLMASREDQESWEFDALKDGVFSYYFLQALWSSNADRNGDGAVSAEEAFRYLNSRVDSYVFSETGYHQYPQMYDGIAGQVSLTYPGCY